MKLDFIFPVPVARFDYSNIGLHRKLEKICINNRENVSKLPNSTYGGFQSDQNFFDRSSDEIDTLKNLIKSSLDQYFPHYYKAHTGKVRGVNQEKFDFKLWGWYTILSEHGWNSPHIHPRSLISGVFYVKTPDTVQNNTARNYSGWFGLSDPRQGSQQWPLSEQMTHVYIQPQEGTLILFPSYLTHFVSPFNSKESRISIAFNIVS
jgi:uncharacterized protein (TIGR02466 family)